MEQAGDLLPQVGASQLDTVKECEHEGSEGGGSDEIDIAIQVTEEERKAGRAS